MPNFIQYVPNIEDEVNSVIGDAVTELNSHELEIIELQANVTVTPINHDTLISDTFNDADGFLDTVNTGNTTATYSNRYDLATINSGNCETSGTNQATVKVNINCAAERVLKSVKFFYNNSTGTNVTISIKDSTETTTHYTNTSSYSTAEIKTHTLTTPLTLSATTDYILIIENASTKVSGKTATINNTTNGITITTVGSDKVPATPSTQFSYIQVVDESSGEMVEIDLPTISGTVIATSLLINGGNGTTYSLEDVGTNTDTSLSIDTKNELTNLTSNPIKLRIYPDANGVKTYCLKLWKA
jgi:hypothetical protein